MSGRERISHGSGAESRNVREKAYCVSRTIHKDDWVQKSNIGWEGFDMPHCRYAIYWCEGSKPQDWQRKWHIVVQRTLLLTDDMFCWLLFQKWSSGIYTAFHNPGLYRCILIPQSNQWLGLVGFCSQKHLESASFGEGKWSLIMATYAIKCCPWSTAFLLFFLLSSNHNNIDAVRWSFK